MNAGNKNETDQNLLIENLELHTALKVATNIISVQHEQIRELTERVSRVEVWLASLVVDGDF